MLLEGKTIALGVTGSVAAYKAADLASRLKKLKAQVNVIMTEAACRFVTPLTFEMASGRPVHTSLFDPSPSYGVPHIELSFGADLMVVAPATANFLGKVAHGIADDLLTTSILAAICPVMICPAMNVHMYANPQVQANIALLKQEGYTVVEPGVGPMACGHEGKGRLPEVEEILKYIFEVIPIAGDLSGLTVLVTAGGTREAIDPVRYISNRSSGKMGYALAAAAMQRGAKVILVTAPTCLLPPPGVEVIQVETAQEMYETVLNHCNTADIIIKAAAVADYRPKHQATHKIKKQEQELSLALEKTTDILYELGCNKLDGVTLVGFAAETEDLLENSWAKMKHKNLDLLVANDITVPGAGFGTDTNVVKLLYPDGSIKSLDKMPKRDLAHCILDEILGLRNPS